MKKRFLITALIICFCGALVSCKSKEQTEEKPKENLGKIKNNPDVIAAYLGNDE